MKRDLIARVAHAVNMAYCASLGDVFIPTWQEATEAQRLSILAGVDMHLANPDTTPEQAHATWLTSKEADGWTYGEVKDETAKQHPCIVSYDELPASQKAKDYIFRAVVHALSAEKAIEPAAVTVAQSEPEPQRIPGKFMPEVAPVSVVNGMVSVTYIGRRETFTDRIYGTKLVFDQGQSRTVPEAFAKSFLKHADLFELTKVDEPPAVEAVVTSATKTEKKVEDDTAAILEKAQKEKAKEDESVNKLQDLQDQVSQMDKEGLMHFALTNYRQEIPKNTSLAKMRDRVSGLISQFGAP